MKMRIPSRDGCVDSVARPGFDVLMAITGARQAASPTARRVAANRRDDSGPDSAGQRRALLLGGRTGAPKNETHVARFADISPVTDFAGDDGQALAIEMNGLFTRAFQAMVKHPAVDGLNKAGRLGGAGPESE